jgi:hypothetical protein
MPNEWASKFHYLYDHFVHSEIDVSQFKARLVGLGFPQGYIDWLVFMCTRKQ